MSETNPAATTEVAAPHRYTAAMAADIEARWQDFWDAEGTYAAPNPSGDLADDPELAAKPKKFIMDMFPYPSGAGLHVGHPLGYIATDVFARFQRMTGHNVLHTLGFDAFGLPAEQYAVQTGTHPRVSTEANIENMKVQLRRLGLGHDKRRSFATIDPDYYRWTQWIFLQIFNSWYDEEADRARPIADLIAQFESGERAVPGDHARAWNQLTAIERADVLGEFRLAYASEAPVNWCPGLGTVLANEEVTADGRSERGNFPVFKAKLRQWNMRITAYADRLLNDLDALDWPEAIKLQQRNWIGRSEGARVDFPVDGDAITVFTTRPDTLFGAGYMVLAPEHPLVEKLTPAAWPEGTHDVWTGGHGTPAEAVAAYRAQAASKSDVERQAEAKDKTGVFIGSYATNPANGERIPVFIADYVLMGYGTGAIMAVPAGDQRDFEFARAFELPIRCIVEPTDGRGTDTSTWDNAFGAHDAKIINSANDDISLDGLAVADAKARITEWLERKGIGRGTVNFRLRDWLFSRQRYWGEPFPIVYDEDGVAHSLPESMLPLELPEVEDYSPRTFDADDADTSPETPLSRNADWVDVTLDLGDGRGPQKYRRETNTIHKREGQTAFDWEGLERRTGQPKILVSIGTTFDHEHKKSFFAKVIEAFAEEPLTVVVVSDPSLFDKWPENFIVQRNVPQLELLPYLDAVVCHGGHNTVCETLTNGLPMVVVPIAYDQSHVAGRVVRVGAGLRLNFNRFKSKHLKEAVEEILNNDSFGKAAQQMGLSFEEAGGTETAADLLVQLSAVRYVEILNN